MRLLPTLLLLIIAINCGGTSEVVSGNQSIIGTWKLMGMVKTPIEIDRVTESELMKAYLIFKSDNTYDGEVTYPRSPERNMRVSGTYTVIEGTLEINNKTNNSTTKSSLKFERDFMIVTPLNPEGFTAYYRRIN